jgi:hypothetical protein
MTDRQLSKMLEALRAGESLESALKAARLSLKKYQKDIAEDPDLEAILLQHGADGPRANSPPPPPPLPKPAPPPPAPTPLAAAPPPEAPSPPPAPIANIVIVPPVVEPSEPVVLSAEEQFQADRDRITREAGALAGGMLGYVLWVDARCVAYGMPQMSEWWRAALSGFYSSGKRWGLFRVGRGGGKSTTLTRVAGAEGVFAERDVPPGQRWIWPFISVATEDSGKRIIEIEAVLRAIGRDPVVHRPNGKPTIELTDINGNTIAFIALAGTIGAVSGPNSIGCTIDEEAKLKDKAKNANPSTEILASLANTFRARPNIRGIRCSSAWTTSGTHYDSIAEGDTNLNYVARIGEAFLPLALDGLEQVAKYESSLGSRGNAEKIRTYADTLTANSPNVPTWVANPTIGAVASRAEIDAIPLNKLGGVSRAEYWLRENASLSLGAGSVFGAGDMQALLAMNRKLNSGESRREGLMQFGGLPDSDPRSRANGRRRGIVL